jgi:hypothetical protein
MLYQSMSAFFLILILFAFLALAGFFRAFEAFAFKGSHP